MKKIIEFLPGLNMGGAETLVKEYVRLIDKKEFFVYVLISNNRNGSPYEKLVDSMDNVCLISIQDILDKKYSNYIIGKIIKYLARPLLIRQIIERIHPDVIHVHLELLRYLNFLRSSNVKIFYTVHSDPKAVFLNVDFETVKKNSIKRRIVRFRKKIMRYKERTVAKQLLKAHRLTFIALHKDMQKEVNDIFAVNNTIILKNGIDFVRFKRRTEKNISKQKEIGIPADRFVIGNVGWLHFDKNPLFVINIASELMKRGVNVHILLVGSGNMKETIINKAKDLSLEDRLTILSNRLDVPELLSILDVFVFPSLYEGLPISLVEAQAVGVKCVVADHITDEVCVSDQFFKISLNEPIEKWCNLIMDETIRNTKYNDIMDFNMKNIVKNLEELYNGNSKDSY